MFAFFHVTPNSMQSLCDLSNLSIKLDNSEGWLL